MLWLIKTLQLLRFNSTFENHDQLWLLWNYMQHTANLDLMTDLSHGPHIFDDTCGPKCDSLITQL